MERWKGVDSRHEHRAPSTTFSPSAAARAHVQCKAASLPQEHVAFAAQTHSLEERLQHEGGLAILNEPLGV